VLATVGVPPSTVTAPLLTRIFPAASRLMVMVLSRASPKTDRTPPPGEKKAVTAGVMRSLSCSTDNRQRARHVLRAARRPLPARGRSRFQKFRSTVTSRPEDVMGLFRPALSAKRRAGYNRGNPGRLKSRPQKSGRGGQPMPPDDFVPAGGPPEGEDPRALFER